MKFLQKYQYQIRQASEQKRLQNNTTLLEDEIAKKIQAQIDWEGRCRLAKSLRSRALADMEHLLVAFEKKAIANKGIVYWAKNAAEANKRILALVKRAEAQSVHLNYSSELTEVGLEKILRKEGFLIQASKLAHFVLQKANEPASHSEHLLLDKSKKGILDFLNQKMELSFDPKGKEASQEALGQMRSKVNKYPSFPSVSVFTPDFIFADSGGLLFFDSEGSSSWNLSSTSINIALVGIDRIMPTFDDRFMECMPVFNLFRSGDLEPNFFNMLYGPAHKDEKDGPSQLYIILMDNGRSNLLSNPMLQGAMLDLDGWSQWFERLWANKVKKTNYPQQQLNHFKQTKGGFDLGDFYFQTPLTVPEFNPFELDYCGMILEMRRLIFEKHATKSDHELMEQLGKLMKNRLEVTKLRGGLKKMLFRRKLRQVLPETQNLPELANETFSEWWLNREKESMK